LYALIVSPQQGIAEIIARDFNARGGASVYNSYIEVRAAVSMIYGTAEAFALPKPGGGRSWDAFWHLSSALPNGIHLIGLSAEQADDISIIGAEPTDYKSHVTGKDSLSLSYECFGFESDVTLKRSERAALVPDLPTPHEGAATPEGKLEWRRVAEDPSPANVSDTTGPVGAASLQEEIANIQEQIRAGEEENARFTGGLVKSLIGARIATMRQTEAMLRQASLAPKHPVDASSNDALRTVETELTDNQTQIARQQIETARYSGGLIRATSLATLATLQYTRAILDQRRLVLKYGLKPSAGTQPLADPRPASTSVAESPKNWRIVLIDARVTEANTVWSRYAWKLTLGNDSDKPQIFRGTIEFQDTDGFIVDTSNAGDMVVPEQTEQVFTGYALIRAEVVGKVARTVAKVGVVR
jgi:hypothetical protein